MSEMAEADRLIRDVRYVAETFIKQYYPEKELSFVATWEAFEEWVKQWRGPGAERKASEALLTCVETGLGFAEEGLDKVSSIILATVAKLLCEMQGQRVSLSGLKKLIGKVAAGTGASGELLAAMVRHLPNLYMEARSADLETTEAHVSRDMMPQYEIWTQGKCRIVNNIDDWEKKKKEYLFWIDVDERTHRPVRKQGEKVRRTATRLLIYLVERLGSRTPVTEILRDVFDDPTMDPTETEKNKIDQQLTELEKFCAGGFRSYIFDEWFKKGLGLSERFSDKYFLFSRLR